MTTKPTIDDLDSAISAELLDYAKLLNACGELDKAAEVALELTADRPDPAQVLRWLAELAEHRFMALGAYRVTPHADKRAVIAEARALGLNPIDRGKLVPSAIASAMASLDLKLSGRETDTGPEVTTTPGPVVEDEEELLCGTPWPDPVRAELVIGPRPELHPGWEPSDRVTFDAHVNASIAKRAQGLDGGDWPPGFLDVDPAPDAPVEYPVALDAHEMALLVERRAQVDAGHERLVLGALAPDGVIELGGGARVIINPDTGEVLAVYAGSGHLAEVTRSEDVTTIIFRPAKPEQEA